MDITAHRLATTSRTPPGVRELKLGLRFGGVDLGGVAPLPGCVN